LNRFKEGLTAGLWLDLNRVIKAFAASLRDEQQETFAELIALWLHATGRLVVLRRRAYVIRRSSN